MILRLFITQFLHVQGIKLEMYFNYFLFVFQKLDYRASNFA